MNPMLIGMLAGAGLGVIKGQEDKKNYKQEQKLNAIKAMYSPWTGIAPTNPKNPSMMGSMMQGGMAGGMMGQQFDGSDPIGQEDNNYLGNVNQTPPSQGMGGYRQPVNRGQQNFWGNQGVQTGRV